MKPLTRALLFATFALTACRAGDQAGNQTQSKSAEAAVAPVLTTPDAVDTHSYAKPLEARVTHVALDLGIDFKTKRIGGTATLDIDRKPEAKEIILDDNGLEIDSVADSSNQPLQWHVGARSEEHTS